MTYQVSTPHLDEVFQTLEEVEIRVAGFAGNDFYKPLGRNEKVRLERGEVINKRYGKLPVRISCQKL